MDLWDVAKVMWRRRWVAVPLLLLSMVAAVFALLTVPPDYNVKGQIAVIPPSTAQGNPVAGAVVNPFTVDTIAELVAVYLNRADVKRQLEAAGLSPDYEITMKPSGLTLMEITVEAKSAEAATSTLRRLIQMVQQECKQRQDAFQLTQAEEISTEVLDAGEEINVVRTVGKRTLIVIVGVGILVTVAISLWVDALIRRRAVREPQSPPARFAVPMPPAPSSPAGPFPPAVVPNAANASTVPLDGYTADNDSTIVLPLAGVSWASGKGKGKASEKPDS